MGIFQKTDLYLIGGFAAFELLLWKVFGLGLAGGFFILASPVFAYCLLKIWGARWKIIREQRKQRAYVESLGGAESTIHGSNMVHSAHEGGLVDRSQK